MAKYDVRVRYAFEGTYTVVAEDHDEARQMVSEDCGLVLGVVRTTYLIDEQGVIIKANDKVKAADDPENMLKELEG